MSSFDLHSGFLFNSWVILKSSRQPSIQQWNKLGGYQAANYLVNQSVAELTALSPYLPAKMLRMVFSIRRYHFDNSRNKLTYLYSPDRPLKITRYRLLNILVPLSFGLLKAIYAFFGNSTVPTTLELIGGCLFVLGCESF